MKPAIIGWIFFAISLLTIAYLQCNRPAKKETIEESKEYKELAKRFADTVSALKEIKASDSAIIANAQANSLHYYNELQTVRRDIDIKNSEIKRLATKVKEEQSKTPERDYVKVTPEYKESCDSMANIAFELSIENGKFQSKIDSSKRADSLLIEAQKKRANNAEEFNNKFMSQLNDCKTKLKQAIDSKKKTQLFAGGEIFGNQKNILGGGRIDLNLKMKNDQIFAASINNWLGEFYYGAGTKFLITFKK